MPRHKRDVDVALIIALLVTIVELVSTEHILAQTNAYTVVELSVADATEVPCRLNNLGDLVGRGSSAGQTRAAMWSHGTLKPKHLGVLAGGDYSSAFAINDAGEIAGASNTSVSIVPFILPCCRAIIVARHLVSTSPGTWLDILPAQMAPELFCGC
jgi:hypothetical protein